MCYKTTNIGFRGMFCVMVPHAYIHGIERMCGRYSQGSLNTRYLFKDLFVVMIVY